ncbi:MAG: glycosyltransferase family 2 protein, partial [Bacilli bacterium]|nr:glycosyltransferase family 2 protein [Bacilli bacterium]
LKSYDLKPQKKKKSDKPSGPPEVRKTRWLIMQLIIAILSLPILFVLLKGFSLKGLSDREIFIEYILSLNRWFIVYYLVVNFLYLTLALFSAIGSGRNRRNWALKKQGFLFEPHALPSISIIAPAYNEELSIVDSVESLLNLNYPSIEVIVVNDGSADGTLEKLINHFNLERENLTDKSAIPTRPVRAIYRNKFIDSLLVIDKENGGKADALNVGINYANSEYVCGIDADSLLEKDSLLILMSSILDSDRITLALGGAVVPVNGCTVDHGQIESHRMPRSWLARFQTIEYLRAFNVSRTGFAHLRSLLIVSGAFGVFEKRILTEVGGYLTVSSLKKDTVGEDMELVVRITRKAYEEKLNFRIDYVDIARCYTEVPEERKSFFRQRNRWQRGLVDILSYHRSLIFNPRYGRVGFLGMPYFYLFEMIGPLFEVQAYLAIILGFVFGLLNIEIVLLLLFVTVVLGMFVSMLSLCISERRSTSYRLKDLLMLVFIAIVENFGWRQLISLYRVKGFIVSFRENNVWGQMNRVGFKK